MALVLLPVCGYASSPDYDKCVADDVPLSECSLAAYSLQDKRLNAAYKAVIKSNPELKKVQREWIKSRDKSCVKPSEDSETYHLLDMYYLCLFEITEKRAAELESLSKQSVSDNEKKNPISTGKSPEEDSVEELKSGKKEIQSNEEAMIAYDAAPIGRVMISPKIKPDGELYGGHLKINQSSNESYFIAEAEYNAGIKYAKIMIPEELKENYLNTVQIGKFSSAIGKYTDNLQYTTTIGETKTMPVFTAIHFLCCF